MISTFLYRLHSSNSTSNKNPKIFGNKAPRIPPKINPHVTHNMMPLKKPSKGMLLKINQYAMGVMMAKRIPPNTAASTFLSSLIFLL